MKDYSSYFQKNLAEFKIISHEHHSIQLWMKELAEQGFVSNDFAKEFLSIFGGLKVQGRGISSKGYVELYFNPVYYAEYDRMDLYNSITNDILFPVGGLYDYTIFIGKQGKYYVASWVTLYECGESIDSFLRNIFSDHPNFIELYNNQDEGNEFIRSFLQDISSDNLHF